MDNPLAKIDAELAQLERQERDLRSRFDLIATKRSRLKVSREVLVEMGFLPSQSIGLGDEPIEKPPAAAQKSTENMITFIGEAGPLWRTANQLQEEVSAFAERSIPMSTISPCLTKMKNAGVLVRDGKRVALISRLRVEQPSFLEKDEPPEDGPKVAGEGNISPDQSERDENGTSSDVFS